MFTNSFRPKLLCGSAIIACALSAPAFAQSTYISGSINLNSQSSSDNTGQTGAFITGNLGDGSTLAVADGTDYGWNTEFDDGTAFGVEIGKRLGSGLRVALEGVYSTADVDTHTGVTLGGGSIDALDAASVAGSPTPLGATVAQVVADGQGDIENTGIFANVYYDFNQRGMLRPYLGAGIGFVDAKVDYSPSAVGIINDSETNFSYQGKAGLTVDLDGPLEVFGEVTYRDMGNADLQNSLFPGSLKIENRQTLFGAGVRYSFGG